MYSNKKPYSNLGLSFSEWLEAESFLAKEQREKREFTKPYLLRSPFMYQQRLANPEWSIIGFEREALAFEKSTGNSLRVFEAEIEKALARVNGRVEADTEVAESGETIFFTAGAYFPTLRATKVNWIVQVSDSDYVNVGDVSDIYRYSPISLAEIKLEAVGDPVSTQEITVIFKAQLEGDTNPWDKAPFITEAEMGKKIFFFTEEDTITIPYSEATTTIIGETTDAMVVSNDAVSWANAHDAVTGDNVTTSNSFEAASGSEVGYWKVNRLFFFFDLSDIPNGATITSATMRLYGDIKVGSGEISIQEGTQASPVTTADFDSFDGTYFAKGETTDGAYADFELDASGITYLEGVIGGTAKLCVREYDHDYLDVDPVDTQYAYAIFMADVADSTREPQLVLTYYVP